jgi:hypothetical protein
MGESSLAPLSCPQCSARVRAGANACASCGYRLLESTADGRGAGPIGRRHLVAVACVLAAVACAGLLIDSGDGPGESREAHAARPDPELISARPLSVGAAERRLEARYGDAAAARCSALEPRPAHSIRHCLIRQAGGRRQYVVLLLDAQGHQVLIHP